MPPKNAKASSSKVLLPTDKIPLPIFLKMLNDTGMSTMNAIAVAGKVYKTHNTQEKIGTLTAESLIKMGVDDKERRREVILMVDEIKATTSQRERERAAMAKALNTGKDAVETGDKNVEKRQEKALDSDAKRRAALDAFQKGLDSKKSSSPSKKRKRGRDDDLLFDPSSQAGTSKADDIRALQFSEVLDEEVLKGKTVTINRAPVMMAWSCVVAETLGFSREEALSIASAYTEMNATAKGASLGIYDKKKEKGMEPGRGTAQPHVELMGRRMSEALMQTESGQWRALLKGEPVSPSKAHSYITRSLAQMSPYLMGAMYLLAQSFDDPQKLNHNAYSLYCDFRPDGGGWGVKGDVKLGYILSLGKRNKGEVVGQATEEAPAATSVMKELKPLIEMEEGTTFEEFEAKEVEGEDFTLWDLYDEDA